MGQLTRLDLQRVGLTDLTFVSNHPLLTYVQVGQNSIADASPLLGLSNLADLFIGSDPILCSDSDLATLSANGVNVRC